MENRSVPNSKPKAETRKYFLIFGFTLIILMAFFAGFLPFFHAPQIDLPKKTLTLDDSLVVHFDRSTIRHRVESTFSIIPNVIGNLTWQGNDLVFKPVQPWEPGEKYQISFSGFTKIALGFSYVDNFSVEELPRVEKTSPSQDAVVASTAPIEFYLDKSNQSCRLNFKVTPEFNYTLAIDPDRKKFQINPTEPLAQDTNYQVIAYESYQSKEDKDLYFQEIANFQFKTLPPPEVQKMIPADKENDVTEFEPIKAYFTKPMKTEEWQNFIEITPAVQGQAQWEDDGKTFIFKPHRWVQNTNYAVKIKGGWQADDNSSLKNDFIASFHSFNTSGIVSKLQAANTEPKIKEGKYIDVNLSKQLLTIFNDGINMGNYRVSSGKSSMPTPTGTFTILNKQRKRWSKEYHLFMPYWMQFTRAGHGIHELPEWPSGYKEGANHLGTPVSHGCVRLGVGSAATVYGFADVGTPVYVHY